MKEVLIGNYVDYSDKKVKLMQVCFSPGDIDRHWDRCGLTANYFAYYIAKDFQNNPSLPNSLTMIFNEIIENAVKYSASKEDKIRISLFVINKYIIIEAYNTILQEKIDTVKSIAGELIDNKQVNKKYLDVISTKQPGPNISGIGLYTIINYYNVELGFKISGDINDKKNRFAIQVRIDSEKL